MGNAALQITTQQIEAWLAMYLWPFTRLAAFMMVAPIFGAVFVNRRVRLLLAIAVTVAVAPTIAAPPAVALLSVEALIIAVQQVLIGVACGFALQLVFDAIGLGGQLLANSMGLSFAFNVDPQRGASTPALGQLYMVLMTLTFLSLDGHLRVIEVLAAGLRQLPVGTQGLGVIGLERLLLLGGLLFQGALQVALPGVTALLVVNLAFGVMSRAAPALNLFAVGFPITLILGLVIVWLSLPAVQNAFLNLIGIVFGALEQLLVRAS